MRFNLMRYKTDTLTQRNPTMSKIDKVLATGKTYTTLSAAGNTRQHVATALLPA